jgi:AAA15 family ATPase/GTPase
MRIGLQNFQGIGSYTEIPIAPITLFYGPNSAGKSTVADVFQFLHNTLSGRNRNWQEDLEKHARRNRKSRQLVEQYIGNPNDVVFKVEGSQQPDDLGIFGKGDSGHFERFCEQANYKADPNRLAEDNWLSTHNGIDKIFADDKKFEYQIHFSQDEKCDKWLLRESLLTIDNQPLFKTNRNDKFHENHDWIDNLEIAFNILHPAYLNLEKLNELIRYWFVDVNKCFLDEIIVDKSLCWLTISGISINDAYDDAFSFSPIDWHRVNWDEADDEVVNSFKILSGYLDFFMVMPAKWASDSCRIYAVPPLRPLPENHAVLEIDPAVLKSNGHTRRCWQELADDVRKIKLHDYQIKLGENPEKIKDNALAFINSILTSRDFLDTGYALAGDAKFKFLLSIDELSNLRHLDTFSLLERLFTTPTEVHLYLIYQPENFPVEIADVGVGISQVVPVLFGCWQAMSERNGVHIQQPELHLHPKLQAQLADVFIKCVSTPKKSGIFLLESHSEQLLLRLLRRIRESHMATVSRGEGISELVPVIDLQKVKGHELKAEQVSVVYVSKDKSGITKMKHLRLSDDGEFIDRWPNGFFAERDIELFGEEGPFV